MQGSQKVPLAVSRRSKGQRREVTEASAWSAGGAEGGQQPRHTGFAVVPRSTTRLLLTTIPPTPCLCLTPRAFHVVHKSRPLRRNGLWGSLLPLNFPQGLAQAEAKSIPGCRGAHSFPSAPLSLHQLLQFNPQLIPPETVSPQLVKPHALDPEAIPQSLLLQDFLLANPPQLQGLAARRPVFVPSSPHVVSLLSEASCLISL